MTHACRINTCTAAPIEIGMADLRARVFCATHALEWEGSPEHVRCVAASHGRRLTQHVWVAALSDFRTRVEAERRNGGP